jgi:hypothetical protein
MRLFSAFYDFQFSRLHLVAPLIWVSGFAAMIRGGYGSLWLSIVPLVFLPSWIWMDSCMGAARPQGFRHRMQTPLHEPLCSFDGEALQQPNSLPPQFPAANSGICHRSANGPLLTSQGKSPAHFT